MKKPRLSFWQIWNMSFGFLGIQFGWQLQLGNMSSIYKFLGVQSEDIPMLWLAAPLTGLIVQPIIGYLSDRTWTGLGRRKPYFLIGAILSSIALILMPNSSVWWMAAGLLWVLDASINITMEPFRAFVADMLPEEQRSKGFAMQSVFIGLGAAIAAGLPYALTNWFGMPKESADGSIPPQIMVAFYLGAFAFIAAVLVTVLTTKEYPPEDLEKFKKEKKEGGGFLGGVKEIFTSIVKMPVNMRKLATVQFFTWLGLFLMWVFFTDTISTTVFGVEDYPSSYLSVYNSGKKADFSEDFYSNPYKYFGDSEKDVFKSENKNSQEVISELEENFGSLPSFREAFSANVQNFSDASDWGNLCFGLYSAVCFIFGFFIPPIADRIGLRFTHLICLFAGGAGLISVYFITSSGMLMVSMLGVGLAWTSILAVPYTLLSTSIPPQKMGIYMGIFNFFIVLPEILNSLTFGWFMENVLGGQKALAMVVGGICLIIAGLLTLRVKEEVPNSERAVA